MQLKSQQEVSVPLGCLTWPQYAPVILVCLQSPPPPLSGIPPQENSQDPEGVFPCSL